MINIAICDDDIPVTTSIEKMLNVLCKKRNIKINCSIFFDGESLTNSMFLGNNYDIIYLDIEMKKMNGINAARIIRDMDLPTLIIYISSYEKYLKDLFDTEPFRFLPKPIDETSFYSAFEAAFKRINRTTKFFSFAFNKEYIKIPLNNICYFESNNRIIYIHTYNKPLSLDADYRFYAKMNAVEKQLSDCDIHFIRIHQSYLVNYDYIKSMNYTHVTMYDGTVLQISEDRQKKVRIQFCSIAEFEF